MEYVLAFDIGTSSVKAALFDLEGEEVLADVASYPTYTGDNGESEQCPEDWWNAVCQLSQRLPVSGKKIRAISVSGHSMGAVPVDKSEKLLLRRVPIWNDLSAASEAERFFSVVDQHSWYENTGSGLRRELYPLFKIARYYHFYPEMVAETACFLGTKDYINMKMTRSLCTDVTDASGSGAYSLLKKTRIREYYEILSIDIRKLPQIVHSQDCIGKLTAEASKAMGLSVDTPVFAGGVDNACMCLGAGCYKEGQAYASLGTSAWVAAVSNSPGLDYTNGIYTFAHCLDNLYIPAVGTLSAGSSQTWVMKKLFGIVDEKAYGQMEELARKSPPGSRGVVFVPTLLGRNGNSRMTDMKGGFLNLSMDSTLEDLCRAVYEGIACELSLCFDSLQNKIKLSDQLHITGGGAKSELWMQIISQVMQKRVTRTDEARSTTALGAASLALVGGGYWKDYTRLGNYSGYSWMADEVSLYRGTEIKACFLEAMLALAGMRRDG